MNTPWGDIAVSDAHVHFFSSAFFQSLAKQKGIPVADIGSALNLELPAADPGELANRWVQALDQNGISAAALMASIPGDEASVAGAVQRYPERFHGYFMFDPLQPEAPQRAHAALKSGLRGICFFPAMHGYSIADEPVASVLDSISGEQGVVVFVHCGVLSVGIRNKLGLPSRFDMRFSNPVDLHPVALRYPQLNFVVPHFGAGYFREALMVADLCPNVYFDTSSSNSWTKYQTPAITLKDVFQRALDVVGPRRLLFGSDSSFFPRGWNASVLESQIRVLSDLYIGPENATLILGGNLRRVLSEKR